MYIHPSPPQEISVACRRQTQMTRLWIYGRARVRGSQLIRISRLPDDSHAFLDVAQPVDRNHELIYSPAWPMNLHRVDFRGSAQAKVDSPSALARISIPAVELSNLCQTTGLNLNPGTYSIAVRFCTDQPKLNPIAGIL